MQTLPANLSTDDHKRMVILGPTATVYDAARALEANHIGCVLVADGDRVLGILTDRDLALRLIGYELDPGYVLVEDIMTPDVATLPVTATAADAARIMVERHVRRVPIEEHGRIAGIVTLDDLVLAGFDPSGLSEVVRAQLAEPTPLKSPTHDPRNVASSKERAERRHAAHAQAAYDALIRRVIEQGKMERRPSGSWGVTSAISPGHGLEPAEQAELEVLSVRVERARAVLELSPSEHVPRAAASAR